jgi:hypothetical protein
VEVKGRREARGSWRESVQHVAHESDPGSRACRESGSAVLRTNYSHRSLSRSGIQPDSAYSEMLPALANPARGSRPLPPLTTLGDYNSLSLATKPTAADNQGLLSTRVHSSWMTASSSSSSSNFNASISSNNPSTLISGKSSSSSSTSESSTIAASPAAGALNNCRFARSSSSSSMSRRKRS